MIKIYTNTQKEYAEAQEFRVQHPNADIMILPPSNSFAVMGWGTDDCSGSEEFDELSAEETCSFFESIEEALKNAIVDAGFEVVEANIASWIAANRGRSE